MYLVVLGIKMTSLVHFTVYNINCSGRRLYPAVGAEAFFYSGKTKDVANKANKDLRFFNPNWTDVLTHQS